MIKTNFRIAKGDKRYVRLDRISYCYRWCEVLDTRRSYDCAYGICDAEDLSDSVRIAADNAAGTYPSYVEWP